MMKTKIILKMILMSFLIYQTQAHHNNCNVSFPFLEFDTGKCVAESSCSGKYKIGDSYICYSKCPEDYPYFDSNFECSSSCNGYIYYDGKCGDDCDSANYKTESPEKCTSVCPSDKPYFYSNRVCSSSCSLSYKYECVDSCTAPGPTYSSDSKCFQCNQDSNKFYDTETNTCFLNCPNEKPYYDQYNECHVSCTAPAKLHDLGSYECKTECSNGYTKFNNICYPNSASCPSGTKKIDNKCECLDKYYEETESDGNIITICLSSGASCPTDKKYIVDKKCTTTPETGKCKIVRKTTTSPVNYECVNGCSFDELKYTDKSDTTFCVTQCPEEKPYKNSGSDVCIAECTSEYENLDDQTKTCTATCPGIGLRLYYSTGSPKFKCYSGSNCPITHSYFYEEKNICLTDCSVLQSNPSQFELGSTQEKYYVDETNKECFNPNNKKCTKSKSGTIEYCVGSKCECITEEECKNLGKYLSGNKCINDCGSVDGKKAHVDETNECVSEDPNNTPKYYYIYQDYLENDNKVNVYYRDGCPSNNYYQDDTNHKCLDDFSKCPYQVNLVTKKCIKCLVPTKDGLQNEGYYINTNSGTGQKCESRCPGIYPYYIGNICYEVNNAKITADNAYQIDGTNEFVLDSCPDGYFLFDKKCYYGDCPLNSKLDNNVCKCVAKFYKSDDTTVCLGEDEPCPLPYKYVESTYSKECTEEVESGCEKINDNKFLIKISSNPENYKCGDQCTSLTYEDNDYRYCVDECPSDYPYRNVAADGTYEDTCLQNCASETYYTEETNHLCYTSCPGSGLSLLNEDGDNNPKYGKCISDYSCPQSTPYLYQKDTMKVCVSDCSKTKTDQKIKIETVLNTANNECVKISDCPHYYDLDINKCVDKCEPDQFLAFNGKKCVDSCKTTGNINIPYLYETRQCIDEETAESVKTCKDKEYFKDEDKPEICYESCLPTYYTDNTNKICYHNGCPDNLYLLEDTHTCVECSSNTEGYKVEGTQACYKKCPDPNLYYDDSENKCHNGCITSGKEIRLDGTYKCIAQNTCTGYIFNKVCYSSLPQNTETSDESAPYECNCVDKYYESSGNMVCLNAGDPCPSGKKYFDSNKKCSDSCSDKYQKKVTIKGVANIECKSSCDEFTYTAEGQSSPIYCYEKCPEDKPFHKSDGKECLKECDPTTHFTDPINYICYEICPDYATVDEEDVDENKKIYKKGKCIFNFQCPTNYPYLYENKICLKDCKSTKIFTFDSTNFPATNTVLKLETSASQCVSTCGDNRFYEYSTGKCLDNCKEGQFQDSDTCYDDCSQNTTIPRLKYGTNECVSSNCKDATYKYLLDNGNKDNYCYKECPEGSYLNSDENGCVSNCGSGEYLELSEKKCKKDGCNGFYDPSSSPYYICYEKCDKDIPYYPTGSKECYASCPITENSEYKLLKEDTYECMKDAECDYQFNSVCYSRSCPELTEKLSENSNECECIYKYYEKTGGEIVCLGAGDPCPDQMIYIVDNKCSATKCSSSYTRKISSSPENYQCVNKCDDDEFINVESGVKYCVKECPETALFYDNDGENKRVCKSSCLSRFKDTNSHICYQNCPNFNTIVEQTGLTNYDVCIQGTSCPSYKSYLYINSSGNKYCLNSCDFTTDIHVAGSSETYLDKTKNQCIPTSTLCSKFTDVDNDNTCVDKCASNQYVYYEEKKCYNSCPYIAYIPDQIDKPYYIVEELKRCVKDCKIVGYYSNGSYNSKRECYKTCPTDYYVEEVNSKCYSKSCPSSAKFLKISLNKCVSECKLPANLNNIGEKEGFTIEDQETSSSTYIICYDNCPESNPYYIDGSNLCLATNKVNFNDYSLADGTNKLLKKEDGNCPTDNDNEYLYLFNNICYKSCPENSEEDGKTKKCKCSFKFYKVDGKDICLGPNVPCPDGKNYFDENNECTSTSCDDSPHKKYETTPVNTQCYTSTCLYDEYLDFNTNECLTNCPENKYHVFGEKKCYTDCSEAGTDHSGKEYFTDSVNKICYTQCPGLATIDESYSKKCLQQTTVCPESSYLYSAENICVSDCSIVNTIYSVSTLEDEVHKECVGECVNKFKDIASNTCVDECPEGSYLKSLNGNECYNYDICSGGSKLYKDKLYYCITDHTNYYSFTSDSTIYYDQCPLTKEENNIYQDDVEKKCLTIIECTTSKKIKKSDQKCVTCSVPENINSIQSDEGFIFGNECIDSCEGTTREYYNYGQNICYEKTDGNIQKYPVEGTNMYADKCPDNYYLFNGICRKFKCPENTYYDNANSICKCAYKFKRSTSSPYDYSCYASDQSCTEDYFDQEKGCLDDCPSIRAKLKQISSGPDKYECVEKCALGEFEYIDENSINHCVETCPSDKKYHIFGETECIEKCDPDNYYTNNIDFTCRKKCDGLATLDESETGKYGECISGDNCPSGSILYPELNLCLSDCKVTTKLTKIFSPNGITTYLHEDYISQCLTKCSSMLNKRYISTDSLNCVEKCGSTEYYDNTNFKCYSSKDDCDYAFYVVETNECVQGCSGYYYYTVSGSLTKECYLKCPDDHSYIKLNSNECTACSSSDEFYVEGDEKKICYSKCPSEAKYYEEGTNKCIKECPYGKFVNTDGECGSKCKDGGKSTNFICSDSCSDPYTEDKNDPTKCVCDVDGDKKFYREIDSKGNEILKCISDNVQCPGTKPYLIRDLQGHINECVEECDNTKLYVDEETKECYETCPKGKYFNKRTKTCHSTCNVPLSDTLELYEGYYVDEPTSSSTECYDQCPSDSPYYNIGKNKCIAEDEKCTTYPNLIEGTYICTNDCPTGYYLFSKKCLKDKCPDNSEYDFTNKICKCKYKYTLYYGEYTCLGKDESCPSGFYNENKQCVSELECAEYRRKMKESDSDFLCFKTKDDCPDTDYYYTDQANIKYCLKECPSGTYHELNDKECSKHSDDDKPHYYDETNKIYYPDGCPNLSKYKNGENNGEKPDFECISDERCPSSGTTLYEYNKVCISSCDLTFTSLYFKNKQTYITVEKDPNDPTKLIYKCVEDCSTNPVQTFTSTEYKRCCEKCDSVNGEYFYGKQCYTSCPNDMEYYLDDTKECVADCKEGYYKDSNNNNNICYKKCPVFTFKEKKSCVSSCEIDEGYTVFGDNENICYSSCPSNAPYHDSGKNVCFSGTCKSEGNHGASYKYSKYTTDDGSIDYTCYDTCSGTFETSDNHCVKENYCPELYPYRYDDTALGKTICYKDGCPYDSMTITEDSINKNKICTASCNIQAGQDVYLQGDKCVTECDQKLGYIYKFPAVTGKSVGYCYTEQQKCLAPYIYFNEEKKECSATCSDKKIEGDAISSTGSCVAKCPQDYRYLDVDQNICYKSGCPSGTYLTNPDAASGDEFKCEPKCGKDKIEFGGKCLEIENCLNQVYKFIDENAEDDKHCIAECPQSKPYYWSKDGKCTANCLDDNGNVVFYNPNTNECTSDCMTTNTHTFHEGDIGSLTKTTACLEECNESSQQIYYSLTDKKCVSSCLPNYYSSSNPRVCVNDCGPNEMIVKATNKCTESCLSTTAQYQITNNGVTYCVNECPSNGINNLLKYYLRSNNKCVPEGEASENYLVDGKYFDSKCPDYFPNYYLDEVDGIYKCTGDCSKMSYQFHKGNECLKKCKGTYKYIILNDPTCYDSCPDGYNYQYEENEGTVQCTYSCDAGYYYSGAICVRTCKDPYKYKIEAKQKCYDQCPENSYISSKDNECVDSCKSNEFILNGQCSKNCNKELNFIVKNKNNENECKTKCGDTETYYYELTIIDGTPIYQCVSNCTSQANFQLHNINEKQCISSCSSPFEYESPSGICYSSCKTDENYPYSLYDNNKYKCVSNCGSSSSAKPYFDDSFTCIAQCTGNTPAIDYGHCVRKCDLTKSNKYQTTVKDKDNICDEHCSVKTNLYYKTSDYKCLTECAEGEYIRGGNICATSCDQSSSLKFAYKASGERVFTCTDVCPPAAKFYYENNKICSTSCGSDYIVGNTTKCVTSCENAGEFLYSCEGVPGKTYEKNTCVKDCPDYLPYKTLDHKCAADCKVSTNDKYLYYLNTTKECLANCPEGYSALKTVLGYECVTDCPYYVSDGICVEKCPTDDGGNIYYVENEKLCRKRCPDGYYQDNSVLTTVSASKKIRQKCVAKCPASAPYEYNSICYSKCNEDSSNTLYIYYNADETEKHCTADCDIDHQYYSEIKNYGNACTKVECQFYTREAGKVGRLCLSECPNTAFFLGADGKQCLSECPTNLPYYVKGDKTSQCYQNCPSLYFHEEDTSRNDKYECKEYKSCSGTHIDYDSQLCLKSDKCKSNQYEYDPEPSVTGSNKRYLCLNSCDETDITTLITPDHKCVKECSADLFLQRKSDTSKECTCLKLYYNETTTGITNCIDSSRIDCAANIGHAEAKYYIQRYGTNECLSACRTIFSPQGECMDTFECPNSNSEPTVNSTGVRYCKCKYKWYYNLYKQIVCLGENEECPNIPNYIIASTGECVDNCTLPYYTLIDSCVLECPKNSQPDDYEHKCSCVKNWITNEKGGVECLNELANCPEDKPYLVQDTKECVSKCPKNYRYLFLEKCLGECDSTKKYVVKELLDSDPIKKQEIADFTCGCGNNIKWYYESNNIFCLDESTTDCSDTQDGKYYFELYDTHQCVEKCPDAYPYLYGNQCYDQCPTGTITDTEKKMCTCPNYHVKQTVKGRERFTCILDSDHCNYPTQLCVEELKECIEFGNDVKICPLDYPYEVNGDCYKQCPEGYHYDTEDVYSCSCDVKFYKATDAIKKIMTTVCVDECPSTYKYLNSETKECLNSPDTLKHIFNNVGYPNHCPEKTKDRLPIDKDNLCICDEDYGFWYKEDTQDQSGYVCALTACPGMEYRFVVVGTNECVSQGQCAKKGLYTYTLPTSTCSDTCPEGRIKNTTTHKCTTDDITKAADVEELVTILDQEKYRYFVENPNGFEYSNFGISSQIFGINQTVDEYKEILIRSNLTYIDFSRCIDKIYASHGLSSDDKLVLLKIDITNAYPDYLINPVEYELYSAKTGRKIDVSICEYKEIIVSYPILDKLNTFSRLRQLEINKTILNPKEQYYVAKKLHDEYDNVDAFNINNTLYTKFCTECVIDGKDLIFRDRIPYIYPINYSLCENNCTFAYTDFESERVNCYCRFKNTINIKKKYSSNVIKVNNNEIEDKQQGPTNFPVLQCMDEYKVKNNGSFYFTAVILLIELILFIFAIIGIKTLLTNIRISTVGEIEENEKDDDKDNNINDIAVYTEHRKLNAGSSDRNALENSSYPPSKTDSFQEDFNMGNAEYIPGEYVHLFFKSNENGVTKQVERNKLPFRIAKTTKVLYEKIDSKKNQDGDEVIKPNKLRIIESKPFKGNNGRMEITLRQNINSENSDNYEGEAEAEGEGDNNAKGYSSKHKRSILNKKNGKFNFDKFSEKGDVNALDKDIYDEENLLKILRNEKKYKDLNYQYAVTRETASIWIMILTFILDKVYVTKLFLFRRKYDIFAVLGSLYLLYHILILSIVTIFFNLPTLSKIFFEDFPTVGFYISYGLLSNLIAWFIYRLLYCLIKNNTTISRFVSKYKLLPDVQLSKIEKKFRIKKYKKLNGKIKFKFSAYYIIQWLMLLFCFFYLCLFSSIYRGTKKEIFKTYGIALLEIFIIRIVYGIVLGCLRYVSINKQIECLYKVVKFFDVYLS